MSTYVCNLEIWNGLDNRVVIQDGIDTKKALEMEINYRKSAIKKTTKENIGHVLYGIIQHDEELDIITTVSWFKNTVIDDYELDDLIRKFPRAEFRVIHVESSKKSMYEVSCNKGDTSN